MNIHTKTRLDDRVHCAAFAAAAALALACALVVTFGSGADAQQSAAGALAQPASQAVQTAAAAEPQRNARQ